VLYSTDASTRRDVAAVRGVMRWPARSARAPPDRHSPQHRRAEMQLGRIRPRPSCDDHSLSVRVAMPTMVATHSAHVTRDKNRWSGRCAIVHHEPAPRKSAPAGLNAHSHRP
jgi:hypothetical protein